MNDYTKGKWKAYCLGSEGYQVRRDNEGVPAPKVKEELKERLTPIVERMGGSFETQRVNAHLIAAAVNACIKLNPANPMTVTESIVEMHEALKEADAVICELCKRLNPQHVSQDYGKGCNWCQDREVRLKTLAKAGVKPEEQNDKTNNRI